MDGVYRDEDPDTPSMLITDQVLQQAGLCDAKLCSAGLDTVR